MKNTFNLFGIIALVAVTGFLAAGCLKFSLSLPIASIDGAWGRATGDIVITINGSSGVFSQINSGNWKKAQDKAVVKIGDQKYRNITKASDSKWNCQELMYHYAGDNWSVSWVDCTITLSSDGKTISTSSSGGSATYQKQ